MQILGKRSKVLLIAVSITMLVAIGVSFAMWDLTAVKATSGDLSTYANAKVGDIVEFGRYYQTGNKVSDEENAEYEKTPIEWLVVDKDERSGQLTLMSKYILAAGSYFGNWYYNENDKDGNYYYSTSGMKNLEVGSVPYNQAYIESTARAFLNNLERRDLGGDSYSIEDGYKTSVTPSKTDGMLLTSVGFSNKRYTFTNEYMRPITSDEYRNRPATRGFYDEAFTDEEKSMIAPKEIPGYIGHRWPSESQDPTNMSYVEGAIDKVWLPSVTELNAMATNESHTNPSDEASSTVFEYFKGKADSVLSTALMAERTPFVKNNSKAMNYSIPVYKYQSIEINEDINAAKNSSDTYWTRSPMSYNYTHARVVLSWGTLNVSNTHYSYVGVRPCVILKY